MNLQRFDIRATLESMGAALARVATERGLQRPAAPTNPAPSTRSVPLDESTSVPSAGPR